MRRGEGISEEDEMQEIEFEREPYDLASQRQTQFFTTSSQTLIIRDLIRMLEDMKIKFIVVKLKLKFETVTGVAGTIRLLKVDEHTSCVEFQKSGGSLASFSNLY